MNISKTCLIFASAFFFTLGTILLFIGTAFQRAVSEEFSQYSVYTNIPTILIICLGASLVLTSLLSLLSIGCRNPIILFVYIIIFTILIIVELLVGAAVFASKSHMLGLVKESMRTTEILYTSDHSASFSWDSIQQNLHCCGLDHYEEWFRYLNKSSLPDSCCVRLTKGCGTDSISTGNFYQTDCTVAISRCVRSYSIAFAILLTFVIIFQFLSLFCARIYLLDLINSDAITMNFKTV